MATRTYDVGMLDAILANIPMEGFAEDSAIEIQHVSEQWTDKVGVDGIDVTRSRKRDARGTVLVHLMQSSATNARLSALLNSDLNSENGAGVGSFELIDRAGTTVVRAARAWITKFPDVEYSGEVGEVVWEIRLADGVYNLGGLKEVGQ